MVQEYLPKQNKLELRNFYSPRLPWDKKDEQYISMKNPPKHLCYPTQIVVGIEADNASIGFEFG